MEQAMALCLDGLDRWLKAHWEEMFADISGIVAIPSVYCPGEGGTPYGKANADAIRYMSRLADKYGFRWENHDWHCISISYGSGEKQLGIWGHLDVVAVDPPDWRFTQPFTCVQIQDFLFGRGTQDNKGPDIGSLYLLRYLKEQGIVPPFEIRLIYGCCEETSMRDVDAYLAMEKAPDLSFVPDCGFPVCYGEKGFLELELISGPLSQAVTELTGGQAINAIPGKGRAVIGGEAVAAEGIAGHSAYPEGTVNAFGILAEKCLKKPDLSETDRAAFRFLAAAGADSYGRALGVARSDEPSGDMTCAPTLLTMEDGRMKVSMNIRYPITIDGKIIASDLEKAAAAYGMCLTVKRDTAPNREDPKGAWVQFLSRVFADVTGKWEDPYVMGGGTYARRIPNAVGFGPGLPKDMSSLGLPKGHGECHQSDESQCIDTLFQAWKIYMCTLLRLIEQGLPT